MNQFEEYALNIILNSLRDNVLHNEIVDVGSIDGAVVTFDYTAQGSGFCPTVYNDELTWMRPFQQDELKSLIDDDLDPNYLGYIYSVILEKGFDLLAYYKSLHYLNREKYPGLWGIFIYRDGIKVLAKKIVDYHNGAVPWADAVVKAFKLLHRHERYHWYIDAWSLDKEAMAGHNIYKPYLYSYRRHFPNCTEEALANAHARSSLLYKDNITDFMDAFMKSQSGMYAQYSMDKRTLRSRLAAEIINDRFNGTAMRPDLEPRIGTSCHVTRDDCNCPVFLIDRPVDLSRPAVDI